MKKVAVWGCAGFVGGACYQTFSQIKSPEWEILGFDLIKEKSPNTKEECYDAELHFVCVPTPMKKETGECDTSIVEAVVRDLKMKAKGWVVIKSTVPPGTTKKMNQTYARVIHNAEYLTEARFLEDFRELPYQIIGTDNEAFFYETCCLVELYQQCFAEGIMKNDHFFTVSSTESEMIKIVRNCYLATRLSFFNEVYQVCQKLKVDYNSLTELVGLEPRIGDHYNKVPGPDGKFGFSKSCLPKDLNDFIFLAQSLGIDPKVSKGVWEKNLEVRPDRDWELEKKAVV